MGKYEGYLGKVALFINFLLLVQFFHSYYFLLSVTIFLIQIFGCVITAEGQRTVNEGDTLSTPLVAELDLSYMGQLIIIAGVLSILNSVVGFLGLWFKHKKTLFVVRELTSKNIKNLFCRIM